MRQQKSQVSRASTKLHRLKRLRWVPPNGGWVGDLPGGLPGFRCWLWGGFRWIGCQKNIFATQRNINYNKTPLKWWVFFVSKQAGGWTNPILKILSSKWVHLPQIGIGVKTTILELPPPSSLCGRRFHHPFRFLCVLGVPALHPKWENLWQVFPTKLLEYPMDFLFKFMYPLRISIRLISSLYMNGWFLYGLEVNIPVTWILLGSKHIPWIYHGVLSNLLNQLASFGRISEASTLMPWQTYPNPNTSRPKEIKSPFKSILRGQFH